jgi:PAS domain S-box-containing protein
MTDDNSSTEPTPLSLAELQAVYHSMTDGIVIHDDEGSIIDVNQAAADMYGYSRSDLRGGDFGPISSGNPPYTGDKARERVQRAAAGEAQTFEWQGQDSDGTVFWEEVSLRQVVVDGETRVIGIVRDIDDRTRAERRFQTLIDTLPGIVYRCRNEPGWPMLFVGGQSEELTGYTAESLESGTISWGEDILHPDERDRLQRAVESAVDADEPFEVTYRIRTADDEERWMWERGQQVETRHRASTILEGFITDVTDRKEYEQQLEAQRDNLEMLNEVVRHDIRNDMTVIRGRARLLEDQVDTKHEETLEAVLEATANAIELTNTARDLSETMLSTTADIESVSLDRHIRGPVENARSKFENAVITIDAVPDVRVRANELLEAVFRNLVQNGIVHNDTERPEVHISAALDAEVVRVRIADNGPGIPDEDKERIFGRGEKDLDSPGVGIGLYLVRTLVEQYGGDVWVTDREPRGAVFVVELAVAD